MHVDEYHFGRIVIDGQAYTRDVLLLGTRICSPWWRREGHCLAVEDLALVLDMAPETLVIGTGAMGRMQVPRETLMALETKGIRCRVMETALAVDLFNRLQSEKRRTAAALHLTC